MLKPNVESFIGCDCDYESARMVLYGAPFDSTTSFRPGARFGPSAMRHESFGLETYSPYQNADLTDCAVFDSGDLELCFGSAQAALEAIEARAAEILGAGKLPLLLGGEHLVTLGAVKRHPKLHIIHFDAHADLRDNYLGADDVRQVIDLINAYKPDLVMNIALPCQDLTIMDACLACGVNYMDTANYEPEDTDDPAWRAVYEKRCKEAGFSAYFDYSWQWAYRKRFEEAGLTALLGCGFDPGVTQAYCAHAKKHEFDTIDIPDCNGGDHGYAFATNFNPEVNLREVSAPGSRLGATRAQWDAGNVPGADRPAGRAAFSHPVRAGFRRAGNHSERCGGGLRRRTAWNEMAQFRRRLGR